jgi:hypothetical protein
MFKLRRPSGGGRGGEKVDPCEEGIILWIVGFLVVCVELVNLLKKKKLSLVPKI